MAPNNDRPSTPDNAGDTGRRFGVEEEFILLDPDALIPINRAETLFKQFERNPALAPFVKALR